MGLESATFIDSLNSANPLGDDPITEGDDHIRLIKDVLLNTLVGADAAFTMPTGPTTLVGINGAQTLQDKTISATNNTITNIGSSEVVADIITGQTAVGAFGSGDKFLVMETGVGLRQADFDDLPGGGSTFLDNAFRVQDNADATKEVAFEASGITTGTTRTLTVQDVNGTVVVTGGADLTVPDGGTGVSSLTDGGILLGSGASAITAMSVLADGAIVVGDGATDPVAMTAFESSTGNLLAAKGGTIGQQTIWIPAGAMEPRVTTAPATLNAVEIGTSLIALRTMDFATDADDHAGFAIQMPKGWNESTVIAQFVWSHATTTVNFGVSWAIRAGAYANSDLLTTALGTAVVTDDTGGTTDDLFISPESTAITIAGSPAAEEWVYFEVFRDVSDPNDDMAIDARLHGVKIHYTIDAGTDD